MHMHAAAAQGSQVGVIPQGEALIRSDMIRYAEHQTEQLCISTAVPFIPAASCCNGHQTAVIKSNASKEQKATQLQTPKQAHYNPVGPVIIQNKIAKNSTHIHSLIPVSVIQVMHRHLLLHPVCRQAGCGSPTVSAMLSMSAASWCDGVNTRHSLYSGNLSTSSW